MYYVLVLVIGFVGGISVMVVYGKNLRKEFARVQDKYRIAEKDLTLLRKKIL